MSYTFSKTGSNIDSILNTFSIDSSSKLNINKNIISTKDVEAFTLTLKNSLTGDGSIYFRTSDDTRIGYFWLSTAKTNNVSRCNRFVLRQYSYNNTDGQTLGNYETYYFPTVTENLSSNSQYYILTTKSPVTIAQGGTGATTVAGARNALGLGNTSGALPIANGGTGATSKSAAMAALGIHPSRIATGGSTVVNLGLGYRGMIFFCGTTDNITGAYSLWTGASDGMPHTQVIKEAPNVQFNLTVASQVTLTSSGQTYFFIIDSSGSASITAQ